ncbi:MAG TPA: hypothetical protein VK502_03845 [Candidatus Saccharimonadales bacterium]|nr:hypothetical protein [Candidatus Saccharimonadales bacterium]
MGQHLQEEGKGKTKNIDKDRAGNAQDEIRRTAKHRRQVNAGSRNSSLADTPLFEAINQDKAAEQREAREDDLLTALEVVDEFSSHTFIRPKSGEERQRYSPNGQLAAGAFMRYLFTGNEDDLTASNTMSDRARERIQMLFVIICLREHVKGTFGQRAEWYNTVRNLPQVQCSVHPVRRASMA